MENTNTTVAPALALEKAKNTMETADRWSLLLGEDNTMAKPGTNAAGDVVHNTIPAGALKDKAKTGAVLNVEEGDGKVITYDKEGEEVEEEKGITKETKADTNAAGDVMDNIDAADAKKEIAEVSEVNAVVADAKKEIAETDAAGEVVDNTITAGALEKKEGEEEEEEEGEEKGITKENKSDTNAADNVVVSTITADTLGDKEVEEEGGKHGNTEDKKADTNAADAENGSGQGKEKRGGGERGCGDDEEEKEDQDEDDNGKTKVGGEEDENIPEEQEEEEEENLCSLKDTKC